MINEDKLIWPAEDLIKSWSLGWFWGLASDKEWTPNMFRSFKLKFQFGTKPSKDQLQPVSKLSHFFMYAYYIKQVYRLSINTFNWHYISNQTKAAEIVKAIRSTSYNPKRLRSRFELHKTTNNNKNKNKNTDFSDEEKAEAATKWAENQDSSLIENQLLAEYQSVLSFPLSRTAGSTDWLVRMRLLRVSYEMDHYKLRTPKNSKTLYCATCDQAIDFQRFALCERVLKRYYHGFDDSNTELPKDSLWKSLFPETDAYDRYKPLRDNYQNILCPKCVAAHCLIEQQVNLLLSIIIQHVNLH